MSLYHYSSLPEDSIRLLRLGPHIDEEAPIQCHLLDYYLPDSTKGTHLYEALPYVWGSWNKSRSIRVGECDFPVTENLYAALSRLRDGNFERIIWVDAICINQDDNEERSRQDQSMAKIYAKASRVIVWLGESTANSDQALEGIRAAADYQSIESSNNETLQQAILILLQRPWFQRVWVLQEVAAARHILIRCGSIEIDGFTFSLGLNSLNLSYTSYPELQNLTRSAIYLIRGAIFQPKHITYKQGRFSLNIRPLGDLMDMYHTREATELHDMVYAVLGMSSDDLGTTELSVDYQISWSELFQRLIKFLLHEEISVETWGDRKTAIIRSKGCILGKVMLVEKGIYDDRQNVHISVKDAARCLCWREWRWTLSASPKVIRNGDLVCLLQGALKPMIIRLCKDHFTIIMITVTPMAEASGNVEWPLLAQSIMTFPRDFLLVWDWERPSGDPNEQDYESLLKGRGLKPAATEMGDDVEKATRLWNVATILEDSESYGEAANALRNAMDDYERASGTAHPHKLLGMESLALIVKKSKQWKDAEKMYLDVIQTRKHIQGVEHPDTLGSMANLASMYQSRGDSKMVAKMEAMMDLLVRMRSCGHITEGMVVRIAKSFDQDVMRLLFEQRGDEVPITERVVEAAARNRRHGKQVLTLLFEQQGEKMPITEKVVKAAAGNWNSGTEVMTLLFEQRGESVSITERVVNAAAGNGKNEKDIMALLFEQRGDEVPITEKVMEVAAKNNGNGKQVMAFLLEQRGNIVPMTVKVMEIVAKNWDRGKEVIARLFEEQEDEVLVIEKMVNAATRHWSGKEVMKLLLEQQGNKMTITCGRGSGWGRV